MIADRFCTNFGPRLASTTTAVNSNFRSFLNNNNNPITLKASTIKELENISKTLASRKAPGYDNIPMNVIKSSFHLISSPLANIINQSLQKGILPDKLKIAKVIPVYKREDLFLLSITNPFLYYRIFRNFLRELVNRVCSRIWHTLLLSIWFSEKPLYFFSCIYSPWDKLSPATDRHETTAGIFQDLSKAFDTIDRQILFGKLQPYGVRSLALE